MHSTSSRPELRVDTSLSRGARALARQAARDALEQDENAAPRTPISSSLSPEPEKRRRPSRSLKKQKRVPASKRASVALGQPRLPPPPPPTGPSARLSPSAGPSPPPAAHDKTYGLRHPADKRYDEAAWPGYAAVAAEDDGFTIVEPKAKPSFIEKVYRMLADDEVQELVYWTRAGDGFIIPDVDQFSTVVLPLYFKSPVYSSFLRQLYSYNFSRTRIYLERKCKTVVSQHIHGPATFRRDSPHPQAVKRRLSVPRQSLYMRQDVVEDVGRVKGVNNPSCAILESFDRVESSALSVAPASPASSRAQQSTSFAFEYPSRPTKRRAGEAGLEEAERDVFGPVELAEGRGDVKRLELACRRLSTQLNQAQWRLKSTIRICKVLKERVHDLGGVFEEPDYFSLDVDDRNTHASSSFAVASGGADLAFPSSHLSGWPAASRSLASYDQRAPPARSSHTCEQRRDWPVVAGPSFVNLSPQLEQTVDHLVLPTGPASSTSPPWSPRHPIFRNSSFANDSTALVDVTHAGAPPQLDEQLLPAPHLLDSHASAFSFVGTRTLAEYYDAEGYGDASVRPLNVVEPLGAAADLPQHAHGPLDVAGGAAQAQYAESAPTAQDVEASAWAAAYADRFCDEWYADVLEPCEGTAPRVVAQRSSAVEAHLEYSSLATTFGTGV
ncbi:hypothetical protein JCM3775_000101 [Rhodotorula graminis]